MSSRKLFVFDIDGTLLDSTHRILDSTRKGIRLLKEADYEVLLASARPPGAIEPFLNDLDLEPFYISLNGALIIKGKQIMPQKTIKDRAAQKTIWVAENLNLSVNVYSGWDWSISEPNKWSDREGKIVDLEPVIQDLSKLRGIHKILVIGLSEHIQELQRQLLIENPDVTPTMSNPNYLEISAKGVTKAKALQVICCKLEVALEDVVVFGDGENDLDMLKAAGIGVAMGNAHPKLKRHAQFVTHTNDADGILFGIEKVLESFNFGGQES